MAPLNEEISRGTFDLEMLPFLCFRSVGLVRGEALRDGYHDDAPVEERLAPP